jgi:DNA-binding NarL/FixJ family response regulator
MKTLTRREEEILRLLASGLMTTLIKEKLSISERTLKKHIEYIYHKLDVHSRYQAVA